MINAYFENIHIQIIKEISRAQQSIKLCVAWFTDVELYNHILRAQERGVIVKIVIANHEFNLIDKNPVDFKELLLNNGTVNYIGNLTNDYTDSLMHHKFCIVDNKVLMTGSYNWTRKARQNDENLLVIEDEAEVVKSFEETIYWCIEIEFFSWSSVQFLLNIHDTFVAELIKIRFLRNVFSDEFVCVFDRSFLP